MIASIDQIRIKTSQLDKALTMLDDWKNKRKAYWHTSIEFGMHTENETIGYTVRDIKKYSEQLAEMIAIYPRYIPAILDAQSSLYQARYVLANWSK